MASSWRGVGGDTIVTVSLRSSDPHDSGPLFDEQSHRGVVHARVAEDDVDLVMRQTGRAARY